MTRPKVGPYLRAFLDGEMSTSVEQARRIACLLESENARLLAEKTELVRRLRLVSARVGLEKCECDPETGCVWCELAAIVDGDL